MQRSIWAVTWAVMWPVWVSWLAVGAVGVAIGAEVAVGQTTPPMVVPRLSDEARVSVLTVLPGDQIHADFGHTAIRVRDPNLSPLFEGQASFDTVFNFGVFDFEDPAFVPKFIWGRMDYLLAMEPFDVTPLQYRAERRPVVEQVLRLTAAERRVMFERLWVKAWSDPTYRYRFFKDNCSTRVRDAVEGSVAGVALPGLSELPLGLKEGEGAVVVEGESIAMPGLEAGATYRGMVEPYMADRPWIWFGGSAMMGLDADESVSGREACFLPLPLMASLAGATRPWDGDERVGVVAETRWVLSPGEVGWRGAGLGEVAPADGRWPLWVMVGLLLGGMVHAIVSWSRRAKPQAMGAAVSGGVRVWGVRAVRWLDAGLLLGVGVWGSLMLVLGHLSAHEVGSPNMHLLWAWPTHGVAAWAVWREWGGVRRVGWGRGLAWYFRAACGVAGLAGATGWWWPQAAPAGVWVLALLVAVRCGWRGWGMRGAIPADTRRLVAPPLDSSASA